MRTTAFLAIAFALALWGAPSSARAAENPVDLSEAAYAAYTAGQFEDAVRLFEAAIAVDPHPVLRFNHARTLEELQRLPSALDVYRSLEGCAFERVRHASEKRSIAIMQQLRAEGYDPDRVTEATYRIPVPTRVRSNASNARVFVNGRIVGSGADVGFRLPSGQHQLVVWAEGYYPFQQLVAIPDEGATIDARLEHRTSLSDYVAPPPGLLTVAGPANGMAIYIDGVLNDKLTPARELLLAEGHYDLLVRHPLYDDYATSVYVRAGVETRVTATNVYSSPERLRRLSGRQRAGNALITVGTLTLAAGAGVGVAALIAKNDYDNHPNDPNRGDARARAQGLSTSADIVLAAGAVTVGTGLVLRLVKPKTSDSNAHYDDRLLDLSLGTVGAPLGATVTFRR